MCELLSEGKCAPTQRTATPIRALLTAPKVRFEVFLVQVPTPPNIGRFGCLHRWDLRPLENRPITRARQSRDEYKGEATTESRQEERLLDTPGTIDAFSYIPEGWSAYDDGNRNTYYVNDATGESVWELPRTDSPHATVEGTIISSTATGSVNDEWAWWESECQQHGDDISPADDHAWPSAVKTAEKHGDLQRGTQVETEWEEHWAKEWDETSQNYYWYNSSTGESRW